MRELDEEILGLDEMEAIRLADSEGLYQADAAEKMGVSRQTFGNILKTAHRKIAEALIKGKAIKLERGEAPIAQHGEQGKGQGKGQGCGMGRGMGRGQCFGRGRE